MILGIDLGQKTTGVAISEGQFASPYVTITHKAQSEAVQKINKLVNDLNADTLVLGIAEGKIRSLFDNFSRELKRQNPKLKIVLWDETLTTRQARETMIKLNIPRNMRAKKEHEVAAAVILQSYLDSR